MHIYNIKTKICKLNGRNKNFTLNRVGAQNEEFPYVQEMEEKQTV